MNHNLIKYDAPLLIFCNTNLLWLNIFFWKYNTFLFFRNKILKHKSIICTLPFQLLQLFRISSAEMRLQWHELILTWCSTLIIINIQCCNSGFELCRFTSNNVEVFIYSFRQILVMQYKTTFSTQIFNMLLGVW